MMRPGKQAPEQRLEGPDHGNPALERREPPVQGRRLQWPAVPACDRGELRLAIVPADERLVVAGQPVPRQIDVEEPERASPGSLG